MWWAVHYGNVWTLCTHITTQPHPHFNEINSVGYIRSGIRPYVVIAKSLLISEKLSLITEDITSLHFPGKTGKWLMQSQAKIIITFSSYNAVLHIPKMMNEYELNYSFQHPVKGHLFLFRKETTERSSEGRNTGRSSYRIPPVRTSWSGRMTFLTAEVWRQCLRMCANIIFHPALSP